MVRVVYELVEQQPVMCFVPATNRPALKQVDLG